MPYSKDHKDAFREKILTSAVKLFSTKGFDQVSINELMTNAGLTRGAFYSHFANKQAVYAEAILVAAKRGRMMDKKPEDIELQQWITTLLANYMSEQHIRQEIAPCPLAFLITDIANQQTEVKNTYTEIFRLLNDAMHAGLVKTSAQANKPKIGKSDIYAAMTMMIGSVAIGRALTDDDLVSAVLAGSRKNVLKIVGLGT